MLKRPPKIKLKRSSRRIAEPPLFKQTVVLSDGSTFTLMSTSPKPVFRSTKDTRNHPLWNPSLARPAAVADECGRLARFRMRFGEQYTGGGQHGDSMLDDCATTLASDAKKVKEK